MPGLPLTNGMYGRPRLAQPLVRAVNCFSEQSPGGPEQQIRSRRPGIVEQYAIGDGPILRSYQLPGLYNGDPLFISGGDVYRKQTLLGTVGYTQFPRIASAQGKTAITSGGGLYVYDGTTFSQVQFFDDGVSRLPPFGGVVVLYNIFIYWVVGSQEFFFSSPGDPTTINAGNFSAAQVNGDNIVEMAVLGEEVYIFKGASTEIWDFTGNLTAPFAESAGRTYAKGCASQNSVVGGAPQAMDNTLMWVGDDLSPYRVGTVPQLLPNSELISDRLRDAGSVGVAQMTAYSLLVENHVFWVINLPTLNESWAYDVQSEQWFQWGTQDGQNAEPGVLNTSTACGRGDQTFLGSRDSNVVYLSDVRAANDNGTPIRMVIAGAIWSQGGKRRCNNVSLHAVRGVGTAATPHPLISMRYSDDGGLTFGSWRVGLLATIGSYKLKATWRNLGMMQQPGRLFEFAVSDAVNFTVQGASYNEARV